MPPPLRRAVAGLLALFLLASCAGEEQGGCVLDDADGIVGGDQTFVVTVDDEGFEPLVLKVQNYAKTTVELTNEGTVARGFVVGCLATPNDDGCPRQWCIEGAEIAPLAPGASASVTFEAPPAEGLYEVTTGVEGDALTAQLIVE